MQIGTRFTVRPGPPQSLTPRRPRLGVDGLLVLLDFLAVVKPRGEEHDGDQKSERDERAPRIDRAREEDQKDETCDGADYENPGHLGPELEAELVPFLAGALEYRFHRGDTLTAVGLAPHHPLGMT